MKTPAERGLYGRWLVAAREARGLDTADKARAALATAGIKIGQSTYAEYESGTKRPSRNHMPLLEGFWGPPGALETTETPADLAAAVRALTVELEAMRREREAWRSGWVAVLRAYGEGQVPTELLDALAPQPLEDARQ